MTFGDLIDKVLSRLQDDDGTLFTRDEVRRWLSEGYRRMTHGARHAKTFTCLDLPPRHAKAITFDWEKSTGGGTWRKFTYTHRSGLYECTYLWEAQLEVDSDPPNSYRNVTHLWEMSSGDTDVDTHYRLMLPKRESDVITVWHDHQYLSPTTARTLDSIEDEWWRIGGEPLAWHRSLGDEASFEIWETPTTLYTSFERPNGEKGIPRAWSEDDHTFNVVSDVNSWGYAYTDKGEPQMTDGDALDGLGYRITKESPESGHMYMYAWEAEDATGDEEGERVCTYPWEKSQALEVGTFRSASSSDRMYFGTHQWQTKGTLRDAGKSENALLVYHSVYPDDVSGEDEELLLIPDQLGKYLEYYAVSVLANRLGEGYDAALAGHYQLRASRGIQLLRKLGMISRVDSSYTRGGGFRGRREPPLPSLPSDYPRAPWLRR